MQLFSSSERTLLPTCLAKVIRWTGVLFYWGGAFLFVYTYSHWVAANQAPVYHFHLAAYAVLFLSLSVIVAWFGRKWVSYLYRKGGG